jgi:hypothetical protein
LSTSSSEADTGLAARKSPFHGRAFHRNTFR